jgi:hypothetical protein
VRFQRAAIVKAKARVPRCRVASPSCSPRSSTTASATAAYGAGGFYDSVNVQTGAVARSYLALDQGIAMGAAVNTLTGDRLQGLFAFAVEQRIRPLLAMEEFTAG